MTQESAQQKYKQQFLTEPDKMKEAFHQAAEIRKFEIELYWKCGRLLLDLDCRCSCGLFCSSFVGEVLLVVYRWGNWIRIHICLVLDKQGQQILARELGESS